MKKVIRRKVAAGGSFNIFLERLSSIKTCYYIECVLKNTRLIESCSSNAHLLVSWSISLIERFPLPTTAEEICFSNIGEWGGLKMVKLPNKSREEKALMKSVNTTIYALLVTFKIKRATLMMYLGS